MSRPIFFNLFLIRLPVAGFMSIIHRVTGVVMVAAIPILLWLLELSLSGDEGFQQSQEWLSSWLGIALIFFALWALMHHFLAGIRYLFLDIDLGIERPLYRHTAWAVLLLSPLLAAILTWRLL
jgi:succinate dehydrogenase / fumarate reductase cytochrome b subunit